ncbi:hypothetical protein [Jeotgalibaca sp. A122]|uniref:hypothetical protein n=1 Tax=Jeotgalibaca sp. A122 TaxID=3457322 RepID=UPI003FD033AC
MAKSKTPSFVLELRLVTHQNEQAVLDKRFAIAENLYNKVLHQARTQLSELHKNRRYQEVLAERRLAVKAKDKRCITACNRELEAIQKSFGVAEYKLHDSIKRMRYAYKKHIDSLTAQKIATTVWGSVSSLLYGKGKKVHFKKFGQLASLEGKTNDSGMRFKGDRLEWNGLVMPVKIRANDSFIQESLALNRVKYCRIVRRAFKGGNKYFLQLVLEGDSPVKRNKDTGMPRHQLSPDKKVGVDIGTSTVAVVGDDGVILKELFPEGNVYDRTIHRLKRKLDRSRRATNPANFKADGTIKRDIKLFWVRSNNYIEVLFRLKDLYRRRAVALKIAHNKTANAILALGNQVYVEDMDFRALMKRTKETTVNKNGRFNRKKRFGKSIGYHAPGLLVSRVQQKAPREGGGLHKVHTTIFRASQYNHSNDTYTKKTLAERTAIVGGHVVQRDLYSAFLLKNSHPTLKETDRTQCDATFATFLTHHATCIQTLCHSTDRKSSNFGLCDFQFT